MADLIQQGAFAAVLLTIGVCLFYQEKSKTGKIICAAAGTVLMILLAFLYRKIQPQGFVGDQFIYLTLLSAIYLTVLAEKPSLRGVFSGKYNKDGYLILREDHFMRK